MASDRGVADVFAFLNDGVTVQAITSDGTTGWFADISQAANVVPDFEGGMVLWTPVGWNETNTPGSIVKLDGITGQTVATYTPTAGSDIADAGVVVGTDGTIFTVQDNWYLDGRCSGCKSSLPATIVGIDPNSGAQKFSVPLPSGNGCLYTDGSGGVFDSYQWAGGSGFIVAGDGYAYLAYICSESTTVIHLMLTRVNSEGALDNIDVMTWEQSPGDVNPVAVYMITNADTGGLLSWSLDTAPLHYMAVTNGTRSLTA